MPADVMLGSGSELLLARAESLPTACSEGGVWHGYGGIVPKGRAARSGVHAAEGCPSLGGGW